MSPETRGLVLRAMRFLRDRCATVTTILLFVAALYCVITWWETIQRVIRYYSPAPDSDYWIAVARLPAYRMLDARVFWQQHNEHRIVFPQLIFAMDFMFLHGRRLLPLALSFLFHLGAWVILIRAFCSTTAIPTFIRIVGCLLAGIVLGWEGSAAVLASPFLIQWTLTNFAALLSLACLTQLKTTKKPLCGPSYYVACYSHLFVGKRHRFVAHLVGRRPCLIDSAQANNRSYLCGSNHSQCLPDRLYKPRYAFYQKPDSASVLSGRVYRLVFELPFSAGMRPSLGVALVSAVCLSAVCSRPSNFESRGASPGGNRAFRLICILRSYSAGHRRRKGWALQTRGSQTPKLNAT